MTELNGCIHTAKDVMDKMGALYKYGTYNADEIYALGQAVAKGSPERSFRRGYHHGFVQALALVQSGVTVDSLYAHEEDRIVPWRESADAASTITPPPSYRV